MDNPKSSPLKDFPLGIDEETEQQYTLHSNLLQQFTAIKQNYGEKILVQFEDFANHNVFDLLDKYSSSHLVFNDDIQGTTYVVLAGLLASLKLIGGTLADHTFLFLGVGEAGVYTDSIRACAAFISNSDDKNDKTVEFRNASYHLPAWSVSILPDCKNVVFNTAKKLLIRSADAFFIVQLHACLGSALVGASLKYFTEEIFPMIERIREKAQKLEKQGLMVSSRNADALTYSLWSLLPLLFFFYV